MDQKPKTKNQKPKTTSHEKGVILVVVLMLIIVVSIYLPAYVTWTIWDQRSLIREQKAEDARAIAQAGLNRAVLDLSLDNGSWLDGEINGHPVHAYDSNKPNDFYPLYTGTFYSGALPIGSYAVEIRYLYNAATSSFYDKRMWIRSRGTITVIAPATETLEQIVDSFVVRNITQNLYYANLQPAIDEAINKNWNNNVFAITDTVLIENININTAMNFTIRGCYAPCFEFRSCADYHTVIHGNWTVAGGANVTLSGITIE
jgi:hypothetical protein